MISSSLPSAAPAPHRRAPSAFDDPRADADDRLLVQRVSAQELPAFETLYRRYQPRLARFLRRILRRDDLIEDVLSDTLFVVWSRAERYSGASKVSTWIFAIAYRKALKAIARHDEPLPDPEEDQSRVDVAEHPDSRLSRVQARSAIDAALRDLSPDQRAAVELTYFNGFTYPEIAQIVDCPVDTVKTRMFHARRRLKAAFAGPLDDWV